MKYEVGMVDGGSDSANHEGQYAPLMPEEGSIDGGNKKEERSTGFAVEKITKMERNRGREYFKAIVGPLLLLFL